MSTRYRVGFFDLEHHLWRFAEVEAPSPEDSVGIALKRLLDQDKFLSDFGEAVTVEVVTSERLRFRLSGVAAGDKSRALESAGRAA